MKKRITSATLAAVTMLGMAAAPAQNVIPALKTAITASADYWDDLVYGDLYYRNDGKQIIITGYKDGVKSVTIPSKIDDLPVTTIAENAFAGVSWRDPDIVSVSIPEGVTTIADDAFYYAENLTTVNIPSTVESIGTRCFMRTKIKSITLPDKVKVIPEDAFCECEKLEEIILGNSVTTIGGSAFAADSELTEIRLPDTLKTVGDYAFSRCTGISRIDVPYSVNSIGREAFGFKNNGAVPELMDNFTLGVWKGKVSEKYADENGIKKAYLNTSLKKADVKISAKQYVYTGKALTPSVTVKINGKTLSKSGDYSVSYKNNTNCGKATVTVTGVNLYMDSVTRTFIIKPKKVTAKKLTSPKAKSVKLTWTKAKGNVDGYQIQLALNKKYTSGKKTVWVKKSGANAKTIKKLKSKKTYFAKIRAFKKIDGKKYYGAWSKTKKVKCK